MSAAEMEVSSTVATSSNSNDSSSNHELPICNANTGMSITSATLGHLQQLSNQSNVQMLHNATPQQRQILVDSNGQIIGNFLVQQQQQQQAQLQRQQQILQQYTLQAAAAQAAQAQAQQHQQQQQQKALQINSTLRKQFDVNGQFIQTQHSTSGGEYTPVSTRVFCMLSTNLKCFHLH